MIAQDLIDFETGIKDKWESGDLPCLLHLSGGNEDALLKLWQDIKPGDWIFSTHRNHYHALLAGIPAGELAQKIENGQSMFVYSKKRNFFCSAVLAGTCGIAAGVAWTIRHSGSLDHVWCFIGDGGSEQGHFWEAINFVEGHELPCTFIVEDNNRSVDTNKKDRRGPLDAIERALTTYKCVRVYQYEPTYPHGGSGCAFQITFKPEAIERMKRQ